MCDRSGCQKCLRSNIALIQNALGGMSQSTVRTRKPSLVMGFATVRHTQNCEIQLLCAVNVAPDSTDT